MTTFKKMWQLLSRDERRSALVVLVLMLIGMVLEAAGIGLVIPALALITNEDPALNYPMLAPLLTALGNPSQQQLVVVGMILLVAVYAIKAAFLTLLAWVQAGFAYDTQHNLSNRLFAGYLNQPWTFHLQRNSAQLIRNVIAEVGMFGTVLQQTLIISTEGMVAFGIGIMLLVIEPAGACLVAVVLGFAAWSFHAKQKTSGALGAGSAASRRPAAAAPPTGIRRGQGS